MSTEETPLPYALEFEEASNILFGVVNELPKEAPAPAIAAFHLQNHFKELGYQDFLISPVHLSNFLKNLKNKKAGRYTLGERRDGKVDISIASDRLSAKIKISKAWGGKLLTNAKIIEAIKHNKIAHECILVNELKQIAKNHHEDIELPIARGRLPVAGKDAELQSLMDSKIAVGHDASSDEAIDQREVYEFAVVDIGQKLMRKIPATAGKPGKDVLGKAIPATAGKDLPFTMPFEGVDLAPDDANVLVATIKGHPVFSKTGVKVDPVLHLESVNIHSGNVDFDGSVFVKDSVASGFTVKATGDIHVKGQVEKANLIAKGDIIVGCGVLGEEDEEGNLKARLSCDGDLHARFVNLAFVLCGGSVNVDEYIMQSRVSAKGEILVGQDKGRGRIIGGYSSSEKNIKAKFLGSDAYVPTNLVLGSEESEHPELKRLQAEHERRSDELAQLTVILEKILAANKPVTIGNIQLDKTTKIQNTIFALENQLADINQEIEKIEEEVGAKDKMKVHVSGTMFPNVSVNICGKGWHCEQEVKRSTFFLNRTRIEYGALEN